jgi:hypothetical protein
MADFDLLELDPLRFFQKEIYDELRRAYVTQKRRSAEIAKAWGMSKELAVARSLTTLIGTCLEDELGLSYPKSPKKRRTAKGPKKRRTSAPPGKNGKARA